MTQEEQGMQKGKLNLEGLPNGGDAIIRKFTTLQLLRGLGRTAQRLLAHAELTSENANALPSAGEYHRGTFLVGLLHDEAQASLQRAEEIRKNIYAKRQFSDLFAPLGRVWTIENKSNRYQLSFRQVEDGRISWTKEREYQMIGTYTFLAEAIGVGDDAEGLIAPLYAYSGEMRCWLPDGSIVGLVLARDAPQGDSQVVNELINPPAPLDSRA